MSTRGQLSCERSLTALSAASSRPRRAARLPQRRPELPPRRRLHPLLPLEAQPRVERRNVREEHAHDPAGLNPALLRARDFRIDNRNRHVEYVQKALVVPRGEAVCEELLQVAWGGELLCEEAGGGAGDASEDLGDVRLPRWGGSDRGEGRGMPARACLSELARRGQSEEQMTRG